MPTEYSLIGKKSDGESRQDGRDSTSFDKGGRARGIPLAYLSGSFQDWIPQEDVIYAANCSQL